MNHEVISKKNETIRNQDILQITTFYANNSLARQDFRGGIYRLRTPNIQLNPFIRSLIVKVTGLLLRGANKIKKLLIIIIY